MDSISEQFSQVYDQYIEKIYRFVYLKVNSQDFARQNMALRAQAEQLLCILRSRQQVLGKAMKLLFLHSP